MKAKSKAMTARKSKARREMIEASSGNVFADLGFKDAEELLLKAKLATKIAQLIEKKGLTQAQIAERIALDPKGVTASTRSAFGFLGRSSIRNFESLRSQC